MTSHNVFQSVKAEISAVIDRWPLFRELLRSVIRLLICDSSLNWLLSLNLILQKLRTGVEWGFLIFRARKIYVLSFDCSNIFDAIDVEFNGSVIKETSAEDPVIAIRVNCD